MSFVRHKCVCCAMWCVIAASSSHAQSPPLLSADIAAQPLTQALAAFAQQTGLQLIYVSAIAA